MTERPAIRAEEGRPSGPVAHLRLSEARVCSHHSGVVGDSDDKVVEFDATIDGDSRA